MISLRAKVVLLLTGSMVLLGGLAYYVSTLLFSGFFTQLEKEFAHIQTAKDQAAFEQYLETLRSTAHDYGYWDSTMAYMAGGDPDFVEENFLPNSLANLDIDLVVIYDQAGTIRFLRRIDLEQQEIREMPVASQVYFQSPSHPFSIEKVGEGLAGMQVIGDEIYFFGATTILNSDWSGEPAGTLVFGRRLDGELAASLAVEADKLSLFWLSNPQTPRNVWLAARQLPADDPHGISTLNEDNLAAYFTLPGLDGSPLVVVWQEIPRQLTHRVLMTWRYFGSVLGVLSLCVALLAWVALDRTLLRRIASLARQVQQARETPDERIEVAIPGNDEVTSLAGTVNETLRALREAREHQAQERDLVKSILSSSPDPIIVVTPNGMVMDCNGATLQLAGPDTRSTVIGASLFELIAEANRDFARLIFDELLTRGSIYNVPIKLNISSGQVIFAELSGQMVPAAGNLPAFCVLHARDVTERMQWETSLRESEERYRSMVESGGEGISILDPEGVFLFANPAAERILGASPDGLIGQSFVGFLLPASIDLFRLEMEKRRQGWSGTFEVHIRRTDREECDLLVTATPWTKGAEGYQGAFCNFRDISERKRTEERLVYLSTHDALTGLYNRSFFEQRLAQLENERIAPVGVLIGDLNHLKIVNDSEGHAAGDELLRTTGRLLRSAFRDEDIIARLGGDEFGIILPGATRPALDQAIQRIASRLEEHNRRSGGTKVSLAIGSAIANGDEPLADAVARADLQMYADKHRRESVLQAL